MATASVALSSPPTPAYRVVMSAGLIAGILDISTQAVAFALRGQSPIHLLQVVAFGLLGKASFDGGLATAALGAVCHFFIALVAAAAYYVASRKLTFLVKDAIVAGLLYGIVVFSFMRYVVLPFSAYHSKIVLPAMPVLIREVTIHMIMVGLPIALVVRWYATRSSVA